MADHILLVEDDEALGAQVVGHLQRAGYTTTWNKDGRGLEDFDERTAQLVVLDLMLPGVFGLDLLKRLRAHSDVPVLILSARNDSATRVRGLQLGADDYLVKPFWPEELVERVRARLRRPQLQRSSAVEVGTVRIDEAARTVTVGDRPVALTATELGILVALARKVGRPVTRQVLVDELDAGREGAERTLDVHVSRLRKKLGDEGVRIVTVFGIGYKLAGDRP